MSQDTGFDDFFEQAGGDFAPTLKFTNDIGPEGRTQVGGGVIGEILSMTKQQQTKYQSNPPQPLFKKDGVTPLMELKIILQTELRDWNKVARVPKDSDGNLLAASEDDGRRAIYVRGWMTGAIGDAVEAATGKKAAPKIGGRLGVKLTELVPTTEGNPYPKYEAVYEAPSGAEGFDFGGEAKTEGAGPAERPKQDALGTDEPPF
jgi:hypothetical protein